MFLVGPPASNKKLDIIVLEKNCAPYEKREIDINSVYTSFASAAHINVVQKLTGRLVPRCYPPTIALICS